MLREVMVPLLLLRADDVDVTLLPLPRRVVASEKADTLLLFGRALERADAIKRSADCLVIIMVEWKWRAITSYSSIFYDIVLPYAGGHSIPTEAEGDYRGSSSSSSSPPRAVWLCLPRHPASACLPPNICHVEESSVESSVSRQISATWHFLNRVNTLPPAKINLPRGVHLIKSISNNSYFLSTPRFIASIHTSSDP